MNIVYIIEDYSENGGVERIVSMKANTLYQQYHHQITLISVYEDNRPLQYTLDKGITLIQLHVPFAPKASNPISKLFYRLNTLLLAAYRLNKVIKQINPNVIFFTTTLGALLLPLCKTKAKKVYESHSARSYTPYHQLFYPMEKVADRVICLTQGDAKEYKHTKSISIIPNFTNTPQKHVENYGTRRAIAVGRLENPKGFDRLIECWQKIASLYPDWQLDIYGEGSLHQALQDQITSLHLNQQVKLCGRGENMLEIYPNYSLHVMSSHYEGQGIVLLEAQACGLPSVTFDFKYGARDIIQDGINGILVKQDDKDAFITGISRMINSEKMRHDYGIKAQDMASKYAKTAIFQKWLSLLDALS